MVARCPFKQAQAALAACGRKRGKGARVSQMESALKLFGITMEWCSGDALPVREALARYCGEQCVGFAVTKGHVTAFGYGAVRDSDEVLDAPIKALYRVLEEHESGKL